jgi:hypothetical protein
LRRCWQWRPLVSEHNTQSPYCLRRKKRKEKERRKKKKVGWTYKTNGRRPR